MTIDQGALILHYIGLAMGFSVSIVNIAMAGLISRSSAEERQVLTRFLPMMGRVGSIGLALLWGTGAYLINPMWAGWNSLSWQLQAKLGAVLLLTLTVLYIHFLEVRLGQGSPTASTRIQVAGKVATLFAISALVFAVLTFR